MNRRQAFLLGAILVVASGLAFFLQDVMMRLLILPLSYLWWVLTVIYRSVAQLIFWGLLITAMAWMAFGSLYGRWQRDRLSRGKKNPAHGPVETVAQYIRRSRQGTYYKWLLSRRLGKLGRDILSQREGGNVLFPEAGLNGRDWHPDPKVRAYLEAGLNRSFADYPRRRRFSHPDPTPFDLDPELVLDFLESQMEDGGDRKRS
jgi:hypothetical protein